MSSARVASGGGSTSGPASHSGRMHTPRSPARCRPRRPPAPDARCPTPARSWPRPRRRSAAARPNRTPVASRRRNRSAACPAPPVPARQAVPSSPAHDPRRRATASRPRAGPAASPDRETGHSARAGSERHAPARGVAPEARPEPARGGQGAAGSRSARWHTSGRLSGRICARSLTAVPRAFKTRRSAPEIPDQVRDGCPPPSGRCKTARPRSGPVNV